MGGKKKAFQLAHLTCKLTSTPQQNSKQLRNTKRTHIHRTTHFHLNHDHSAILHIPSRFKQNQSTRNSSSITDTTQTKPKQDQEQITALQKALLNSGRTTYMREVGFITSIQLKCGPPESFGRSDRTLQSEDEGSLLAMAVELGFGAHGGSAIAA